MKLEFQIVDYYFFVCKEVHLLGMVWKYSCEKWIEMDWRFLTQPVLADLDVWSNCCNILLYNPPPQYSATPLSAEALGYLVAAESSLWCYQNL